MGKVNVVLPDGKVVTVDEEVADVLVKAKSGTVETGSQAAEAARQQSNEENTSALGATVASGVNTALAGIPAMVGMPERVKESIKQHPGAALVGDIAAVAAPTGLLGKTAKVATEGTLIGQAAKLGQMGTAGRVGEGIILGGTSHVSRARIADDPLTIEGLTSDIGIATILNVGLGAVADRMIGVGKVAQGSEAVELLPGAKSVGPSSAKSGVRALKARALADEAEGLTIEAKETWDNAVKTNTTTSKQAMAAKEALDAASGTRKKALEDLAAAKQAMDESPEYAALRDRHNTALDDIENANKTVQKEVDEFAKFASDKGAKKLIGEYEAAQSKLRTELKAIQDEVNAGVQADTKAMYRGPRKGQSFTGAAETAAKQTTPSVNPIDSERLHNLNKALSEVTKLKDAAKNALKEGDFELLHTYMPGGHARVEEALAAVNKPGLTNPLSVKLPDIPKYPGQIRPSGTRMPETLTDLGKMHTDTIAKVANSLDEAASKEVIELGRRFGIEAETAGDALTELRNVTRKSFHGPSADDIAALQKQSNAAATEARRAADEVASSEDSFVQQAKKSDKLDDKAKWKEATAEVDRARDFTGGRTEWSPGRIDWAYDPSQGVVQRFNEGGSLLGSAKGWARSGVIAAAGRAADIGGWKGAILRRLAYGAAGKSLDGVDSAMAAFAGTSAKAGVLGRIGNTVRGAVERAGRTIGEIRPLTAYLGPYAKSRIGRNDGKAAKELIDEVYTAVQTAPDATYELMKGFAGSAGDLGFQLYAKVMNSLQYLADTAPKDPGVDISASGSNWSPNAHEVNEWLHRYEATLAPEEYIARVFAGEGHPAGIEALAYNSPAILNEVRAEAAMQKWDRLTLKGHEALSLLFQRPMSAAQDPDVITMIQGQYLMQMNQPQPEKDPRSTGGPVGRPAAVQSPVAGSNVSQLIG